MLWSIFENYLDNWSWIPSKQGLWGERGHCDITGTWVRAARLEEALMPWGHSLACSLISGYVFPWLSEFLPLRELFVPIQREKVFSLGKNDMVPIFNMNFVTVNLKRISYFIHIFLTWICGKLHLFDTSHPLPHFNLYRYSEVHRSGAIPFIQMTLDELETEIT